MSVGRSAVTVLIVDDSEEFLLGACAWVTAQPDLRLAGTARSGAEALVAVERLRPDLVLMDVAMPGMDGLEATRRIKARPGAPLVVMLTFHASQVARQEAWAAGADGFVSKADVSDALHRVIGELLADQKRTPSVHVNPEAPARLDSQGD